MRQLSFKSSVLFVGALWRADFGSAGWGESVAEVSLDADVLLAGRCSQGDFTIDGCDEGG